jgi:hypothetical protein
MILITHHFSLLPHPETQPILVGNYAIWSPLRFRDHPRQSSGGLLHLAMCILYDHQTGPRFPCTSLVKYASSVLNTIDTI